MLKRGQFYLIAAIIIIAVISGFFIYENYAKTSKENVVIYDLGKELKLETASVYDYGTYNSNDTDTLIGDWATKYYEYTQTQGSVETWVFVYGDRSMMKALTLSLEDSGSVYITPGGGIPVKVDLKKTVQHTDIPNIQEGKVNIKVNDIDYPFELGEGQNFFFVIKGGESTTTG